VSTQPRAPPTLLLRAEIRDEKNNQTDFFSEFKRDLLLSLRTIWSQKTNDKICYYRLLVWKPVEVTCFLNYFQQIALN